MITMCALSLERQHRVKCAAAIWSDSMASSEKDRPWFAPSFLLDVVFLGCGCDHLLFFWCMRWIVHAFCRTPHRQLGRRKAKYTLSAAMDAPRIHTHDARVVWRSGGAWIGHAGRSRNFRLRTDALGECHQRTTARHRHIAMVCSGCRCRPRAEEPWTCGGARCGECVKAQVAAPLPAWSRCAHECAQGGSSLVVGATLTTCAHTRVRSTAVRWSSRSISRWSFTTKFCHSWNAGCRRAVGESHMSCCSGVWSIPYAVLMDTRSLS